MELEKRNPGKKVGIATTVVQCSNCGLIFSNPMPVPSSFKDHYEVDPKRYWNEEYFEVDENYFSMEIKKLQEFTNGAPGLKTLDIGAGLGKQMFALRKVGYDVYGFEPSQSFCTMARKKFNGKSSFAAEYTMSLRYFQCGVMLT